MRRTPAPLVAALLAGPLVLAGCGGSTTAAHVNSTRTVTQTVTTPPPTTSSATPPTTTTATATTTTAGGGSGACSAHDLVARFIGQNGATGNTVLQLALRNTGTTPCHTYGYPGVAFLARSGAALATTPTHTTQDLLGSTRLAAVTVGPGQEMSFRMVAATDAPGGGSCPTAYGLQIIAPDDTAPLRVSFPTGVYECGRTTVSPIQAGGDAAPGV
jgi:hypothetical protein